LAAPLPIVLIVEDDLDVLRVLRKAIGTNAEVVVAMNATIAKECLKHGEIDVVLTDHNLTDGTGLELLTWLEATDPSVRRVLATAGLMPEAALGLCHAVVQKPAPLGELRRAVLEPWL